MSADAASHSTSTRDAALRRLSLSTRWLVAGSVALTGALSEAAAHAFPGKTVKVGAQSGKPRHRHSRQGAASSLAPPRTAPRAAPETHAEPTPESAPAAPRAAPETHAESTPESAPAAPRAAPETHAEPTPESAPAAPRAAPETHAEPTPEPALAAPEAPVVSGAS